MLLSFFSEITKCKEGIEENLPPSLAARGSRKRKDPLWMQCSAQYAWHCWGLPHQEKKGEAFFFFLICFRGAHTVFLKQDQPSSSTPCQDKQEQEEHAPNWGPGQRMEKDQSRCRRSHLTKYKIGDSLRQRYPTTATCSNSSPSTVPPAAKEAKL